ncbi:MULTISPECIES: hormogonium polysaccharide secretion pseudopilin HpsB [Cyanophyceae]|uniref:hormogonium polysaccharide secretion pseudopilin HpsB n=1 Tax=Cyanophyceae TaxID=3028117 RepID=UPI001687760B|nr:hormogonium polysaccharide secretion pseudopilin HpsB [Trichocoleus sp. FACHB-40]MBD2003353.1 type II secretion system protein [Trichocoleus sp. FACHB-40]
MITPKKQQHLSSHSGVSSVGLTSPQPLSYKERGLSSLPTKERARGLGLRTLNSSESGFTLIESLLAIIVVAILLSAIAPVIVLSTATRVQARRVELGSQAARTYIDGIRSGRITPPLATVATTKNPTKAQVTDDLAKFSAVKGPNSSGSLSIPNAQYKDGLYCIDGDGDGSCLHTSLVDMVVQPIVGGTVGVAPITTTTGGTEGYPLLVRVYRADAFSDTTALKPQTDADKGTKQATFTEGLGARKLPVVAVTTAIASTQTSFTQLCNRLGCTP